MTGPRTFLPITTLASQAEGRGGCGPSYTSRTPVACPHSGILLCLLTLYLCPGSPTGPEGTWKGPGHTLASSGTHPRASPRPALPCLHSQGCFSQNRSPIRVFGQVSRCRAPNRWACWRCRAQEPASRTLNSHEKPSRDARSFQKCPGLADRQRNDILPRNTGVGRPPPLRVPLRSTTGGVCPDGVPHWTG